MTETVTGVEPAIADLTPVDTEVTADAAPAVTDADDSQDPKRKPGAEARISELTRFRRDAERDRDYWREQAMRTTPASPATAQPEAPKKAPTLADYDYDEAKFSEAFAKHVSAETARQVREDLRKEETERTQRERKDTFVKREKDFATKHTDYEELTRDPSLPITKTMVELVEETENGPGVLYYLANNRDEAAHIARMDERSAARAIGRIESKLEGPVKPAPPPKPVSKAPPPPPQIEAVEPAVSKDPSEMSDAEFAKWRRRQIAQRR